MKRREKILLLILSFYFFSSILNSTNLYVGPGQQYSTFESALDNAQTGDFIIECFTKDIKHFSPGIQWVSFPYLSCQETYSGTYPPLIGEMYEQAYYENGDQGLLQDTYQGDPTITGFFRIDGKRLEEMNIQYVEESFADHLFYNMLFRHEGYKIEVDEGANSTTLIVDGERLEYYELDMTELENYWLGYYLPQYRNIEDAFGNFWVDVNKVWAEDWYYDRLNNNRGMGDPQVPANSTRGKTMEYGKMYIVQMYNDVNDFHWYNSGDVEEPRGKEESQSFSYTEKADYEAIDVVNIPPDITEIGVFEEDECVGAVVVEDSCAQILVYSDNANRDPVPFSFEVVTGRGIPTPVKDYFVLNQMTGEFESSIIISGRQGYYAIKLGEQEEPENIITKPILHGNYPNPFNPAVAGAGRSPATTISFNLTANDAKNAKVEIYNIKGQRIKTLECINRVDTKATESLSHYSVTWDGKDENDKPVSSGIYFYKLKTGKKELTRKMLLLK